MKGIIYSFFAFGKSNRKAKLPRTPQCRSDNLAFLFYIQLQYKKRFHVWRRRKKIIQPRKFDGIDGT